MAAHADAEANAALVKTAMIDLFVKRDPLAGEKHWATVYTQHNPDIPNGREDLPEIVKKLPPDFSYTPGMVVAQGDRVMIHGRYVGWGPKPLIAVDIFRIKDGKIAEHWDVLQEEVPASQTKSGNPMFSPGE